MMKLQPVTSSNIEAVGFDPATRTLTVKFKGGGTYHYEGCTQEHYDGLISAQSVGKYFHKNIRNGYKYNKAKTAA